MSCIAMDGERFTHDQVLNDHHCGRCAMKPVPISYRDLGYDVDEAPSPQEWLESLPEEERAKMLGGVESKRYQQWKSGEWIPGEKGKDWFKRQPEAVQIKMMGKGKWQAWKDGKFDLKDLSKEYDDPIWGKMRVEKPLKELIDNDNNKLMRELAATQRNATEEELNRITSHISNASFDERQLPVKKKYQGLTYQGKTLGNRESSLTTHLTVRVVSDKQWAEGTTATQYVNDLRKSVMAPDAAVIVYQRRGGHIVGILAPNTIDRSRPGEDSLPYVYIVYSPDRGIIISGYQVSSKETIAIQEEHKWLRE